MTIAYKYGNLKRDVMQNNLFVIFLGKNII